MKRVVLAALVMATLLGVAGGVGAEEAIILYPPKNGKPIVTDDKGQAYQILNNGQIIRTDNGTIYNPTKGGFLNTRTGQVIPVAR